MSVAGKFLLMGNIQGPCTVAHEKKNKKIAWAPIE
jgi:hypothetical protein